MSKKTTSQLFQPGIDKARQRVIAQLEKNGHVAGKELADAIERSVSLRPTTLWAQFKSNRTSTHNALVDLANNGGDQEDWEAANEPFQPLTSPAEAVLEATGATADLMAALQSDPASTGVSAFFFTLNNSIPPRQPTADGVAPTITPRIIPTPVFARFYPAQRLN